MRQKASKSEYKSPKEFYSDLELMMQSVIKRNLGSKVEPSFFESEMAKMKGSKQQYIA